MLFAGLWSFLLKGLKKPSCSLCSVTQVFSSSLETGKPKHRHCASARQRGYVLPVLLPPCLLQCPPLFQPLCNALEECGEGKATEKGGAGSLTAPLALKSGDFSPTVLICNRHKQCWKWSSSRARQVSVQCHRQSLGSEPGGRWEDGNRQWQS